MHRLVLPQLTRRELYKLTVNMNSYDQQNVKNPPYRKALMCDFMNENETPLNKFEHVYDQSTQFDKPNDYRIQGEYGAKKFIKP